MLLPGSHRATMAPSAVSTPKPAPPPSPHRHSLGSVPLVWHSVSLAAWCRSLSLQPPYPVQPPPLQRKPVSPITLASDLWETAARLPSAARMLGARDHLYFFDHILLFAAPQTHISATGCRGLLPLLARHLLSTGATQSLGDVFPPNHVQWHMRQPPLGASAHAPGTASRPRVLLFANKAPTPCPAHSLPFLRNGQREADLLLGMPSAGCGLDLLTRVRPSENEEGD